jgi:GNAT superfamily N-acetyltransferase
MRLREFAPSPDRDHNDDVPDPIFVLANRWWNAAEKQPQIEHVLNSLGWSIHQVESEDDAVQLQHRDGTTYFISADDFDPDLFEISDKLRQSYLGRAGQQVDRRQERMSKVRDRLNKGYEIYHADRPAGSSQIVDRFEADTPALAQQYYEKFIHNYESDRDFDLRLRRATGIMEIARIPQGDFGDADTITAPKYDVKKKELPGGAGFTYAVGKPDAEDLEIMIFDGDTLAAELDLFYTQDATKAWRVSTVAVDPKYRGRGLGKALYGIALSILRLTLEAGDTQTRHGQRMWLMLNSIPGVEVLGYNMERTSKYKPRPGDDIIAQNKDWTRYTFPVRPGTHGMRSARHGTGMYTSQASMIAKWTGR